MLEVVSPSSVARDQHGKRRAYDALGVREYVIFTPRVETPSTLEGYRRDATGAFVGWQPDQQGRLWSEVLGLFLVARGSLLQAQTPDGHLLLTPEQASTELRLAEEENERLRRELEQYRSKG